MSEIPQEPEWTKEELSRTRYSDAITESASDNGLETYERYLGFKSTELEGKTVLDMGIGRTNRFQRELSEAGVEATVIGVSYDLADSTHRNRVHDYAPESRGKNVAAVAEVLPFGENSVDMIFALYSLTYYSMYEPQAQAWVAEFGKVLKPGGEARLAPVYGDDKDEQEMLQKFADTAGLVFELVKPDESSINDYYLLRKPE